MFGRLTIAAGEAGTPVVRRPLLAVGILAALLLLASAVVPVPAHAQIPSVDDVVRGAVERLFRLLFGDDNPIARPAFFEWLASVPNYPAESSTGSVQEIGELTR